MQKTFSFQWHITDECDQRCKHCYIYADKNKKPASSSYEQMEKILENCLDFCRKTERRPYFFLTGGDPILHPDFWTLLARLKKEQIPFTILGNPFHLTEEVCTRLKEHGCVQYQLSLDGDEKTHDFFRKPGSFEITLKKIPLLKKAGIRTAVMSTVSVLNAGQMIEIYDTAVQHGVDVFAFGRYCPDSPEEDCLDPLAYRDLLERMDQRVLQHKRAGSKTYFSRKDHLWTLFDYEKGRFQIPEDADPEMMYGGCNCGNSHLTILPTGEVYACRRVKESRVGNALIDSIYDLWFGKMEDYRDYDRFEKCTSCELKAWCRGCPAVARGYTGSFYGADPQCWKGIERHETDRERG